MNSLLGRQLGVADAPDQIAAARMRFGAEYMAARVSVANPVEGCLSAVGSLVIVGWLVFIAGAWLAA